MCEIKTEILINTSQHKAWETLTNFGAYPSWSTFVDNIEGEIKEGAQIKVTITPIGKKSMVFSSTLLTVKPDNELRWRGALLHPWVFQGEHYFIMQQIDDKTQFIHGEKFTGVLVPILKLFKFIENTKQGFEAFNVAFKKRIETE